jgi:glycosyltransferase involved in cell wall biosynthesis
MPRVSIGVPVHNGEKFLAAALESLLRQTFVDLEVVVSDNASTDATPEIVQAFARRDPRVRYHRNQTNIGAAPNFNLTVDLARGEFFKWAAHDDVLAPSFVERCVEALDRDPSLVLAYPKVKYIDEQGREIEPWTLRLPTDDPRPSVRYVSLLDPHECFEVFGIMRREALLRTPMMGAYAHGDGVLLARLALMGPFVEIPEYLFFSRRHPGQSISRFRDDYNEYAVWFDPRLGGKRVFAWWRLHFEWLRSLSMVPLPTSEKLRCLWHFGRVLRHNRHRLIAEVRTHVEDMVRPARP